jgi:hypothetical protein
MRLETRTGLAASVLVTASSMGSLALSQTSARPDLTGVWDNGNGITHVQVVRNSDSICVRGCEQDTGARPPPDRPRYKPEFLAKVRDLDERQVEEDSSLRCQSPGLPRIGPPDKIVQLPTQTIFLYDDLTGNYFRIIPTDGRSHDEFVAPSSLGDSIGYWEGDEFVVEAINFTDDTWLTDDGTFHTENLRVVERLRRDGEVLHYQATAYDPEVLAEPWQLRPRTAVLTDLELVEAPECVEQDLEHIVDGSHHDNVR